MAKMNKLDDKLEPVGIKEIRRICYMNLSMHAVTRTKVTIEES